MTLSEALNKELTKNAMSYTDAVSATGLSKSNISRYCLEQSRPNLEHLILLIAAFPGLLFWLAGEARRAK